MTRKMILAAILAAFCFSTANAFVPHSPAIPDIPGYVTLKGDFHIHTCFSDGSVWPVTRIDEAEYDGLDVLAITDHCDSRHRKMMRAGYFTEKADQNASFEMAYKAGKRRGMIVLHGAELTRGKRHFAGHFNAHFILDGVQLAREMEKQDEKIDDLIPREEAAIINGLHEARRQGAFITWNHPNWEAQEANEPKWLPIHEKAYSEGLMDGIEIVNAACGEYCPEAFHWAIERNLTVVSGTDAHSSMNRLVDYERGEYRPMTLVFATGRNAKAVREALDARRTAVLCSGKVLGRKEYLEPLYHACIQSKVIAGRQVAIKIKNVSSIPAHLVKGSGSENVYYIKDVILNPGEEFTIKVNPVKGNREYPASEFDVNFKVMNYLTDVDTPLEISYHVALPDNK